MKRELLKIETVLKITFILVPIVAGADKFTNYLVNWVRYLNPHLADVFPFSARIFMLTVGVIEIGAGLLVWISPKVGSYVLLAWFVLISLNLIATGRYYDIAVRDLVMGAGAYALARLSAVKEEKLEQVPA